MTAQETALLIGALVGLFGAIQAYLVANSVDHSRKLDGLMAPRIQAGAETAIALDHGARNEPPTPSTSVPEVPAIDIPRKPFSSPRG